MVLTPRKVRNIGIGIAIVSVFLGFMEVNDGWVECGSVFSPMDRGAYKCQGMDARQVFVYIGLAVAALMIWWAVVTENDHKKKAIDRTKVIDRTQVVEKTQVIEKTQIDNQAIDEIERHQEDLAELKKQDTNEEFMPSATAELERKVQLDKQRAAFETAARKKEKRLEEKAAYRLAVLNRESPKRRSDWSDALTKMSQSDQKDKKNVSNAPVEALREERSERRQNAMDDSSENKPTD